MNSGQALTGTHILITGQRVLHPSLFIFHGHLCSGFFMRVFLIEVPRRDFRDRNFRGRDFSGRALLSLFPLPPFPERLLLSLLPQRFNIRPAFP